MEGLSAEREAARLDGPQPELADHAQRALHALAGEGRRDTGAAFSGHVVHADRREAVPDIVGRGKGDFGVGIRTGIVSGTFRPHRPHRPLERQARFLLLPWVRVKCLASKALGLSLRQLAADWQRVHGIRPVLAETYVSDAHKGTCYRASNWLYLGQT